MRKKPAKRSKQRGRTLDVCIEVLRKLGEPVRVKDIVAAAGDRLPTNSKTPETVVSRDLAMNIIWWGAASEVVRTEPGLYTLRELIARRA